MATSRLTIIQINLHYSKGASSALMRGMTKMHTGTSLIQEPWLVRRAIRGLEGLALFVTGTSGLLDQEHLDQRTSHTVAGAPGQKKLVNWLNTARKKDFPSYWAAMRILNI